jgi:hypothetical protein
VRWRICASIACGGRISDRYAVLGSDGPFWVMDHREATTWEHRRHALEAMERMPKVDWCLLWVEPAL